MKVCQLSGWSSLLSESLSFSVGDDEKEIAGQVNSGIAQAFSFDHGRAYCVLRVDGSEFVVVCFEGEGLLDYCPLLIEAAKAAGAAQIRFHAKNRALGRMVRVFGIKEKEIIYSMRL